MFIADLGFRDKTGLIALKQFPLKLGCWSRRIYGNCIYAKNLLRDLDILAICEHWLYQDELVFSG